MSIESSNYDPMAIHHEVDEIYAGEDAIRYFRALKMNDYMFSRSSFYKDGRVRPVEVLNRPDLFGGSSDDTPAEDNLTIVEDS